MSRNSYGYATIVEEINTVMMCANSAVRESKKVRTMMGRIAYGIMYTFILPFPTIRDVNKTNPVIKISKKPTFALRSYVMGLKNHMYKNCNTKRPKTSTICPIK